MMNCVERISAFGAITKPEMLFPLIIILAALAIINAETQKTFEDEWQQFLKDFQPRYTRSEDQEYRKTIFMKNLKEIRKHNEEYEAGLHTYSLAVNQFADKTESELIEDDNVFFDPATEKKIDIHNRSSVIDPDIDVPDSYDWRDYEAVTRVRNQGYCHSSWAFAAIGSIEGQYSLDTDRLVTFSEQQLIDCSLSNDGCRGGSMSGAFYDLHNMGGVAQDWDYPYEARDGQCRFSEEMAITKVAGYTPIDKGDEEALKRAVVGYGPAAASLFNTAHLHHYHRGIFYDKACNYDYDFKHHAVLIVGYGTERGEDYWLVKNSWGTHWGQNGYGKIARNRDNHCDIAGRARVPYLKPIWK